MTDQRPETPRSENGGTQYGRRRHALQFGRTFFKEPAMLGSLIPSSRFLVRRTLAMIDWSRTDLIVEYGPGLGTFTREILDRIGPEGKVVAFETHPDFVARLRRDLPDPRLEVVHRSAEEVAAVLENRGWGRADYVLSGIPFSLMPEEARVSILRRTRSVLDPDGAMLIYQFSPRIGAHLKDVFGEVKWKFEPRNFPPATLFLCQP